MMNARVRFVNRIATIINYKIKANEDHRKHTSTIYKLANAKRKEVKAAARAAKAKKAEGV